MAYERQIIHYDSDSTTFIADWTERAESAWFELLRQGGCGAGEVVLDYKFTERGSIEVGHYVVMAYSTGIRWYMGRVESIDESSPMRTVVNLYGMVAELGEVFPGGRGGSDIGVPHRYAKTDAFNQDPDWSVQTWDVVSQPNQVVTLLYQQYIDGATHIDLDPGAIEVPDPLTSLQSLVFRSQESALSIIRQLATIANNASWGVDANGDLFFKRMRTNVIDTFQEGVHLEKLTMTTDRSLMCNSLLITGDYVYDPSYFPDYYRYQGRWMQTTSVAQHGEIRRNIFLPWCRTDEDAVAFAKQFFRYYAWPSVRHNFTTRPVTGLIKPWDGFIKLWDAEGANYAIQPFDRIRVQFDQFVKFDIWMGFEEMQFPDWDQDLRWELPEPEMWDPPPPSVPSLPSFPSFYSESQIPALCDNLVFSDDFSGTLSGYTFTQCIGSSGDKYIASSGRLKWNHNAGRGSLHQSVTVPSLNGLCLAVESEIFTDNSTAMIYIGGGVAMWGTTVSGSGTLRRATRGVTTCTLGTASIISGSPHVSGDKIAIVITDASSGGGTYDVAYYLNDTVVDTQSGVAFSFTAGSTIDVGVDMTIIAPGGPSTAGTVEWDNLKIYSS